MTKKAKKPRAQAAPSYWWFGSETTTALRDQLNAALEGGARLEVRIDKKKNMMLTVVPLELAKAVLTSPVGTFTTLNKSFLCPPICP